MSSAEAPVRVLKITGLGRSGSTVLDVVLGNHPRIESVGEVMNLFRTGWISRESLRGVPPRRLRRPVCTCGKRLDVLYVGEPEEACPFWSRVRDEWVERAGGDDVESYPRLQHDFELKRRWPRLLYEGWRGPSARFGPYARLTGAFFESVRAVSGKPVVVDCSKISVRAYALGMVPGIELYAVHLVRDGRGVIASHRKSFEKDLERAAHVRDRKGRPRRWKTVVRRRALYPVSVVRWVVQNLASEWVCARLGPGRALRLRYEDFVADPEAALEEIGSLVGLDLTELADAAASGKPMGAGHNVGGNKTKKSGAVTLRADTREWRVALSPAEQRISWALMGWLMRRYGYQR